MHAAPIIFAVGIFMMVMIISMGSEETGRQPKFPAPWLVDGKPKYEDLTNKVLNTTNYKSVAYTVKTNHNE